MNTMKGLDIFEKITYIKDQFVEEAAEMPHPEYAATRTSRWKKFSRFMNSGWGVAMICGLVAAAVMAGIIAAGRMADPVETIPGAGPTHPTMSFSYALEERDVYRAGDTFTIQTEVKNLGAPFSITGSSQEFSADAWLILHGYEDVYTAPGRINALFAYTDDHIIQTIEQGETGTSSGIFTIPQNAFLGSYDLVLAYKGEYQVFERVITIEASAQGSTDLEFSIKRFPSPKEYSPGDTVTLDFGVTGFDSFYYLDIDMSLKRGYTLSAVLTPHGRDTRDASAIVGQVELDVEANAAVSSLTWEYYTVGFDIPDNPEEGLYDLYIQYVSTREGDDRAGEILEPEIFAIAIPTFTFSYQILPTTNTFVQGQSYTIYTNVTNKGEPFTITGSSTAFSAEAHLVHHDDPQKILYGTFWYTEDIVTQEITTDQVGRHSGSFTIPSDAATGDYDLWLKYGEEVKIFEKAITVIDPGAVPPLSTVIGYESASTERLKGFTYDEFIRAWGQPEGSDSNGNVYYWRVPNQASYDYVTVWFDANNIAEGAQYAYVMKVTVLETRYIIDDPRNLLVEPYRDPWKYQIDLSLRNTSVEGRADTIEVGTTLYVAFTGGILETAPGTFDNVIDVTLEPPVPYWPSGTT